MTVENIDGGGFVVTGEHIQVFRLLALQKALKLELIGLKSRAPVCNIIRDILRANNHEAPRNKRKLFDAFNFFLNEKGIIVSY